MGCFQFGVIRNSTDLNILVHVHLQMHKYKSFPTVCASRHPPAVGEGSCFPVSSQPLDLADVLHVLPNE